VNNKFKVKEAEGKQHIIENDVKVFKTVLTICKVTKTFEEVN